MLKDVTAIIVTYNSRKIISDCLKPLKKANIKTIIVDNASTDDTVEVAKKAYPEIKIIHAPGNIGYGRGNNLGLKATKTKYGLILNPDVTIDKNAIEELLNAFKQDKQIVLSAPLSIDTTKSKEVDISRNKAISLKDNVLYVNWVWGCCLCFDVKKLIKEVGLFDEKFFLFYEEDDLIDRIRETGLKIVMPINSVIRHEQGSASETDSKKFSMGYRRMWNMHWSRMYYREKRKGLIKAKIKAMNYIIKGLFIFLFSKNKRFGKSLVSANFTYLIGFGSFLKDNITPRV